MRADTGGEVLPALLDVSWGGGRFVAVGANGAIVHSTDGDRWTNASANQDELWSIAWGGGRFVAIDLNGMIAHSPDGVTWTSASAPATEERLSDVTWGGGRFVAVGGRTIVYSADGDRWTAASDTATETDDRLTRVASNGTRFVAVGRGSGMIVHSDDGDQWMRGERPRRNLLVQSRRMGRKPLHRKRDQTGAASQYGRTECGCRLLGESPRPIHYRVFVRCCLWERTLRRGEQRQHDIYSDDGGATWTEVGPPPRGKPSTESPERHPVRRCRQQRHDRHQSAPRSAGVIEDETTDDLVAVLRKPVKTQTLRYSPFYLEAIAAGTVAVFTLTTSCQEQHCRIPTTECATKGTSASWAPTEKTVHWLVTSSARTPVGLP